ncbi:oligosaccharide flippase family protein [Sphingomonas sp. JC676]|uniref:lipopolysaccharide biosynthesis protein n=1 Tax=Sphingomonas sp. JC676 TaxID=2768065 RepID=UPI001657AAF8|nr:oligosaccharide flippase family protein [Sphingomonas sp. JC676]MBC9032796.1 oligosaccharide flippase family protein [Sphingomonas sp. JC676]
MVLGFGVKGIGSVTSFLFTWLIARAYGPAGVGAFGTALTTSFMAVTLALMGLDFILVRTVAVLLSAGQSGMARTAIRHALRISLSAGLALTAGLILFRDRIATDLLGSAELAPELVVLALVIPGMVYSRLVSNALRGLGQVGSSQLIEGPIGSTVGSIFLGAALLLGLAHDPLLPAILYLVGWSVGDLFGAIRLARATRNWAPAEPLDRPLLKPGFFILVANASNLFIDWFATIVLAATHGPAEAGIFRIGYQIASSLKLLAATSETILHPVFAASFQQGDLARIGRILRITVGALLLASAPVVLVVLVAPHWIMGLFGSGFKAGAVAMQVLVFGQVISLVMAASGGLLVMAHREKLMLVLTLIAALLAAVLALTLIPPYGALGAAIATTMPFVFLRLASMAAVRWSLGVRLVGTTR